MASVPVIRQTFQPGDLLPYWVRPGLGEHHLYDIGIDPDENENRVGPQDEKDMLEFAGGADRALD